MKRPVRCKKYCRKRLPEAPKSHNRILHPDSDPRCFADPACGAEMTYSGDFSEVGVRLHYGTRKMAFLKIYRHARREGFWSAVVRAIRAAPSYSSRVSQWTVRRCGCCNRITIFVANSSSPEFTLCLLRMLSGARTYTGTFYDGRKASGSLGPEGSVCQNISSLTFHDDSFDLTHIPILNSTYEPLDAHLHLCLCRFERDEAALEVHTPWVRSQTNHFSSFSMLLGR
jgi:hypothetical protein